MIIESDYLTEGLFGQVYVWMLEVLPYIDEQKWRPDWRIRTKNYGEAPDFNIFPSIIQLNYEPEAEGSTLSFEELQRTKGVSFRHDFRKAGEYWNKFFCWPADVSQRLDDFWTSHFRDATVLGVHYRGTDKNVDTFQTNPVSLSQYLCVVEDFLDSHPDVNSIFVASDDQCFIEAMSRFPNVCWHEQKRSEDNQPLWNRHDVSKNHIVAKEALLDCLTLAKCKYGLKCMSQLSAFSKVVNPELEIYRVSACKPGWFPEAFIPLYKSSNKATQALLKVLQQDDFQSSAWSRGLGLHRRAARLANQAWKRRNRLGEKAKELRLWK